MAGIKADDQTALTLGHLACSGLATGMDTDQAAALVRSQSMMTPHVAAKAAVEDLACTPRDTPRPWPGWKPLLTWGGRGSNPRPTHYDVS
ncbi:DUF732 domain-containing protein [Mycobacterium sp.]|uniref:DUF732 domain-containing protein n=1 Tax=Mycobacterium sp. TaxID=1785 RepID=UPI003CC5DB04